MYQLDLFDMNQAIAIRDEKSPPVSADLRFVDLFAGIGGFHFALHALGARCVFASEIDPHARLTYEQNLKPVASELFDLGNFAGDISSVDATRIPDHDILCGGFPCQPFSQAGFKKGFHEAKDNRGNMFFEIERILKTKRPSAFFLENVRHLKNHDDGRTLATIQSKLEGLGYSFLYKVVKASDHGLPQHRPRLFMVGFKGEKTEESEFRFPEPEPLNLFMSDIFGAPCNKPIGYTLRVGGRGSGLLDRRNWDGYLVDGKEHRLTPKDGIKMMGLPEGFQFPTKTPLTQAMKQLGNSVAVPAVKATGAAIINHLNLRNEKNVDVG
ncbi:DNA cytosine methyltransferase [Nereida sp. MMG025]|uniref:DNA cytosine methyltransferase n=1 Tax=Nereida sp. MMG025 TaxID=2909981 RepID=UPI001F1B15BE|nr:DNA cytosine methyltransferase [Nereida sp. MMG025]MCF6443879.1 DNA cytosine methyltransferase [Nereida sp. MMG025]